MGRLLYQNKLVQGFRVYGFIFLMYVSLNPPALPGYQVLVGAIGCLEQTNSLGNLKTGTLPWSPQGHHNIIISCNFVHCRMS